MLNIEQRDRHMGQVQLGRVRRGHRRVRAPGRADRDRLILIWQQLVATVGVVYTSADTNIQIKSGCTPDPISAGGGCS